MRSLVDCFLQRQRLLTGTADAESEKRCAGTVPGAGFRNARIRERGGFRRLSQGLSSNRYEETDMQSSLIGLHEEEDRVWLLSCFDRIRGDMIDLSLES